MSALRQMARAIAGGLAITASWALLERPALAQQFFLNPSSVTAEVLIETRELSGQADGYPKRAEWYSSDLQVVELSYPIYLHYQAPAPGAAHISHVIRVRCLKQGNATITAVPVDITLISATATVTCRETPPKQPPPSGEEPPRPPQNIEDCRGPGAENVLKWTTPIDLNGNFAGCASHGTPNQCDLVRDQTLCAAVNSFVAIRDDGQVCSECHYRGSGSTYSPDVTQGATGGINRQDFAPSYADAFLTKDRMGSPGYKKAYLRALIHKWKDDGYQ